MEDALQRLDKLTQEEARMATAEILRLTQIVDNKVTTVDNKVITVDNKVTNVDNKVTTIGSKVTTIDSKVKTVDNKVTTIVNGERHVSDWLDPVLNARALVRQQRNKASGPTNCNQR